MDQRNEYSKKAIREALIRLSRTKPYTEISVRELCREAKVSRSTFYNNYRFFNDVVVEMSEAYMEKLNHEYVKLLTEECPASKKFWALDERIKQDRRRPGVILEMSKSNAVWNIVRLIHDGVITIDDLCDFSSELKNSVSFLLDR